MEDSQRQATRPSLLADQPGLRASPENAAVAGVAGGASPLASPEEIVGPSGLRVVLEPTPGAPEVTVCMSVQAGTQYDPPTAAGAQRVLAEMLLPGGFGKSKKSYSALVESRGGRSTLFVRRDVMSFCTTAPAVELPLALWVTGGRYTRLALTEDARVEVVERLADLADRTDEDVFGGRAPARLRQMAFLGADAYAHPELPISTDLTGINLGLLCDLHEQAYVAARSVVSISGGFESAVAKRLLSEQLAPVRPGKPSSGVSVSLLPQSTERFSMAEDATAKTPAVWYGWVAPTPKDELALRVALLAAASERRLGRTLIGKGRAAKEFAVVGETTAGPRLLSVRAVGTSSGSLGTIEKLLETELRTLATKNLTEAELTATLERLRAEQQDQLLAAPGRALALSEGLLRGSSPAEVLAPLREEGPVLSPDEVRVAALTWLTPEHRSAVEVYPKGWQDPWQTPMPTFHIVSPGETLTSIARQHQTTVAYLTKLNDIASRKPIFPGDKLKVPRSRQPEVKLRAHTVRRGDTLSGLALRYGVTAKDIAEQNGMSVKQPIRTGQSLTIPQSAKKSGAGSKEAPSSRDGSSKEGSSGAGARTPPMSGVTHQVAPGETLGGIALRHGVRLSSLASANGLSAKSMVRVGQVLVIPQDEGARRPGAVTYQQYAVQSGDTLSAIAKRHGVTVTELEQANGFSRKATLRAGQQIKIPKKAP